MMFLKKSLVLKASLALLALGALAALADVWLLDGTSRNVAIASIAALFFFAIAIYYFWLHLPLKAVFREMKAFISGRTYKKIFTTRIDEVGVLAHFFNDVTRNLEKVKIALAEGHRMSEELSVGNDIQRKILPTVMPQINGLFVYGRTRPASEVGGDSFDIIPSGKNTFIYTGDVTGHGIPAALIMIMVNTLIRTFAEISPSGYDILVNTNRILKTRIEPRRFMTCVLLRWSSTEQKMYFSGGGHEHIIVYHKKDGTCEARQTGGIALGMVPDISRIVKEEQIPLETGDFVVLYSDGIIEAKNMEGEMFGLKRLQEAVGKYAGTASPEDLFVRISKDFAGFVGESVQEDDITLIAIQKV